MTLSYLRLTMFDEGVIKFRANHQQQTLAPGRYGDLACKLIAWREILAKTRLVGQEPGRYGGFGYGNVSGRVGAPAMPRGQRSFLITGTQTSGKPCVSLADFCLVHSYDDRRNEAHSSGPSLPSSESLTHGAIYDLGPQIRFVLHGHTPTIWHRAQELRIPTSNPAIAYGTPQMAAEVRRLYRTTSLADTQILAMGGHEDGVIVFGHTAEEAGRILLTYLAKAFETDCRSQGGLCSR